jgi:magnesium-transporting ATPase (P-type)
MNRLIACPFCRQMFELGEARACPECGLALEDITKLPPLAASLDDEEPLEVLPPDMEQLSWTYLGRGRGALTLVAVLGLGAFFLPWMHEMAPELRVWTGLRFAERLSWMWAPFVSWFVMVPLVLSRRSIHAMRGARFAVGLMALIVIMTAIMRIIVVPQSSRFLPVRYEWSYGLWSTLVLGLVALVFAIRFGGSRIDMPSTQARRGAETVH